MNEMKWNGMKVSFLTVCSEKVSMNGMECKFSMKKFSPKMSLSRW